MRANNGFTLTQKSDNMTANNSFHIHIKFYVKANNNFTLTN